MIDHDRKQLGLIENKQILSDCGNNEGGLSINEVILNNICNATYQLPEALFYRGFNCREAKLSAIQTTLI